MLSNTAIVISFTSYLFSQNIAILRGVGKFDIKFHENCMNLHSTWIKFYMEVPILTVQIVEDFCEEKLRLFQASAAGP